VTEPQQLDAVQVTAAQYAVASDTHWESQLVAQQ